MREQAGPGVLGDVSRPVRRDPAGEQHEKDAPVVPPDEDIPCVSASVTSERNQTLVRLAVELGTGLFWSAHPRDGPERTRSRLVDLHARRTTRRVRYVEKRGGRPRPHAESVAASRSWLRT